MKIFFSWIEKKNWLGLSDRITMFDGNSDSRSFARDLTVSGPVIVESKQLLRYLLIFILFVFLCTNIFYLFRFFLYVYLLSSGVLIRIDLKDRMNKWCGNIFIYLSFTFDIIVINIHEILIFCFEQQVFWLKMMISVENDY